MILLGLKRIHPSPFFIYLFLKCYHIASHEICMLTSSLLSRILLSFMKFEIYTTERSSWVPSNNRLNVELLSVRYKTNSFFFPSLPPLSLPPPPLFFFFLQVNVLSSSVLQETHFESISRISFNFFEFQDAASFKTTQARGGGGDICRACKQFNLPCYFITRFARG